LSPVLLEESPQKVCRDVPFDLVVADLRGVATAHTGGYAALLLEGHDVVDLGQVDLKSVVS
jgi:hypothetical protein